MSLRRAVLKSDALPPSAVSALEIEVTNVTRIDVVMDTGLPLFWDLDLEKKHSYEKGEKWLTLTLGERVINIALNRILYFETRPSQLKTVVAPR